ncbi:unnamed protein product [Mytilus coruscus]|uniref:Uncharacterized protein n=1 Tax=Mytilus coruscus TaxID=42192 RepID=A0A6J8E0N5_MYTCO|nr:unnamed protein product [Mytilus coruscus]
MIVAKKPKLGPSVQDEIANIVNQGSESTVDHRSKEVQELLEKYVRPENCDYLEGPKVNKVLWTLKETDKRLKDSDHNFQRMQGYLVNRMIPLVLLMDKSLKSSSEESEENFELALDSLNMLLYAHRDLSSQRKRLLTPALDKKYSVLSKEGEKISAKYLFGEQEDLEKRMKEIDDSVKLGKKIRSVKGFGKDKTREPEKSNRDNNKSNGFNSGYSSGFKSSFLAKRAQMNREGKKNKKGKGNLGHKKQLHKMRKMKLSKESIDCVKWWILKLPYSFKPIVFKSPDIKIESDSSMIGYGAHDVTNNLDISERTAALRNDVTQLFVSHQKPHKAVKKCTIANWIKKVLALAGIDMTIFTPS